MTDAGKAELNKLDQEAKVEISSEDISIGKDKYFRQSLKNSVSKPGNSFWATFTGQYLISVMEYKKLLVSESINDKTSRKKRLHFSPNCRFFQLYVYIDKGVINIGNSQILMKLSTWGFQ